MTAVIIVIAHIFSFALECSHPCLLVIFAGLRAHFVLFVLKEVLLLKQPALLKPRWRDQRYLTMGGETLLNLPFEPPNKGGMSGTF